MKKNYRKDIDGLRAIAVLMVVFYHLNIGLAPAGFVGVDIFFVISGYLITSHIHKSIANGQFSLKSFYLRRMRRILPALTAVLLFTTVVAYFLLIPADLKNYSKSLLATLCSVSNFYFWKFIHVGYFSTDASTLPLLHTWSLGVEEQFYLFWPLLLIVLLKRYRTISPLKFAISLMIISFLTYYFFRQHDQFVYYSPVTRAFELLIGAVLAMGQKHLELPVSKNILNIMSIAGLLMILFSGFYLTPSDYPGLNVLLPVVGAALLIYAGNERVVSQKVLTARPLVFIGLISYSLYLWHWPIIAYLNYVGITINFGLAALILFVSILLSYISWKFVEQPFRYRYLFSFKKTCLIFIASPILLTVVFDHMTQHVDNFAFNQITEKAQQAIHNQYYGPILPSANCHNISDNVNTLGDPAKCTIGKISDQNTQALIVGDSHAMAEVGMLSIILKNAGIKAYIATQSNTPFLLLHFSEPKHISELVRKRNAVIEKLIETNHYQYVVMGGVWSDPSYHFQQGEDVDSSALFKQGVENSILFILKHGATPVIVLDFPSLFNVPVHCGATRISVGKCYNALEKVAAQQNTRRHIILALQKKYPTLIVIDPRKVICQDGRCYSSITGVPLYFTGKLNSHLNFIGSALVGKLYLRQYGNPFLTNWQ